MEKLIQLSLLAEAPQHPIPLPQEQEEETMSTLGMLLLQILAVDKGKEANNASEAKEAEDDLRS